MSTGKTPHGEVRVLGKIFRVQLPPMGDIGWIGEEDRQRLLENAFEHVCARAKGAPFIYVLAATAIAFISSAPTDHRTVMAGCVLFVVVSSCIRLSLQAVLPRLTGLALPKRISLFFVGISLTALAWGGFTAATSVLYRTEWVSFAAFSVAAFAALSSSFGYSPIFILAFSHCVLLLFPPAVGLLLYEDVSLTSPSYYFTISSCLIFWVYLFPLARRMHREYWLNAINTLRIELQSAELAARAEEIAIAKELAERANIEKTEFLATVSHELRTPLSGMLGAGELVLQMPLGDEQRDYVDLIRRSGVALLRLIEDLLVASRLDRGNLELRRLPYAPVALAREVLSLFDASAQAAELDLQLEASGGVPACVIGDAGRIKQVLMNLVSNAIHYTRQGKIRLHLQWHEGTDGPSLCFAVSDTGPGIAVDVQARLFQRYSAPHLASQPKASGTGLGLAISRELARAMGGEISLESVLGSGSIFTFCVPASVADATLLSSAEDPGNSPLAAVGQIPQTRPLEDGAVRSRVRQSTTPQVAPLGFSPSVLLADDDPVLRKVVGLIATRLGCRVATVVDGAEAIERCEREQFDLIVLDMQMPKFGGMQVAETLRRSERHRATPIIGISANVTDSLRLAATRAGMNDVLQKPLSGEVLREVITTLCRRRDNSLASAP